MDQPRTPSLSRGERSSELRRAFALVHGFGARWSEAALVEHIIEYGIVLPNREERQKEVERRKAAAEAGERAKEEAITRAMAGDTADLAAPSSS